MEHLKKELKFNQFDIPAIYYFESGNIFTGSKKTLNFKIIPDKENLVIQIWHGFICSELAEIEETQTFEMSETGHQAMLNWLTAIYDNTTKNRS